MGNEGCPRPPSRFPIPHPPPLLMTPKRPSETFTEMVQVVLPNDANPLGFILGGTVMHLIDIAGAIACHRHTRSLLVTAAVDGLQFLHPIKVGDLIILRSCVTAAWTTSLEVEVEVFSEETLTGIRRMTSRAYLTFVATDRDGARIQIPGLILETEEERRRAAEAEIRRAERLKARKALEERLAAANVDSRLIRK
jgi:acyl-CoA hydrolase